MPDWKQVIRQEWKRRAARIEASGFFPLVAQGFDEREIIATVDVLLTGRLTMGEQVRKFEATFAKYIGAKYAVMVNSGSSANLLALAVAANPLRKNYLKPGDEVLVPAVCWSTSVWPIVQMGLKPVFVDASPETLNVDLNDLRRKITKRTRARMAVHILGNAAPMKEVFALVRKYRLLLIEDTCESLGVKANGRYLGSMGDFGCYSFYYSHHITTGEGGMVTCNTLEDYDLLKCLRAHGWSRELSNREQLEKANPQVDPRFLFVNLGYNLRPMEVQAAFGLCQLDRLATMNKTRNLNRSRIIAALKAHPRWSEQMEFPEAGQGTSPVWFGFVALLKPELAKHLKPFLKYLSSCGVENRPVVSGNFTRQPSLKLAGVKCNPKDFPGAEAINQRGFFFGLHTEELTHKRIQKLADLMLAYDFK
jgi:CDP-6-deoxy-D-xylo-4-hexulose-3-dehydrase